MNNANNQDHSNKVLTVGATVTFNVEADGFETAEYFDLPQNAVYTVREVSVNEFGDNVAAVAMVCANDAGELVDGPGARVVTEFLSLY